MDLQCSGYPSERVENAQVSQGAYTLSNGGHENARRHTCKFRIATNALSVEYTFVTLDISSFDTVVELPPPLESPHVTTLPHSSPLQTRI